MSSRFFPFVAIVAISPVFLGSLEADNVSPALALPAQGIEMFPATKLRAYGTLSAERKFIPGQPMSSAFTITCESEDKAKLVLAKYLSDLGELEGVNPLAVTTARGSVNARQLNASEGVVAAVRSGKLVYIFTASDGLGLKAVVESNMTGDAKIDATDAEIPVPMYVDRWDKYGFRFYYGPFVVPQDADHHDVVTYDPKQDFTFAKQSGDVGLVLWTTPAPYTNSDGIMSTIPNQWVLDAAKNLKLPVGINLGLEDRNFTFINRDLEDEVPNADGFLGGWYGAMNLGGWTPAWSSDAFQDVALGEVQNYVRELNAKYDNIVNWLEPHEEMQHGVCDLVDDHGPHAKDNFHEFLKSKYGTPEAVAQKWSQPGAFKTWDDVPFPELATFLNYNAQAIDLTGTWKISFTAPYGADSAKPDLDDSSWDEMQAPGHAVARNIPRQPAVFRRHIKIDAAWHAAHPRVWLYLWDFNDARRVVDNPKAGVYVFVNGKAIPETDDTRAMAEHSCALEVSSTLTDGDNIITICLPQAMIDYRCYLSYQEPKVYPALGPQLNAQWADFSDWTSWSRGQAVRRGAQMIRQIDPDRPITMMSPGSYLSDIKKVAEDYGGIIHDTGGMAGSWGDAWPVMMQSSGLPTDCEPGSGAVDLNDFKRFMGRWSTEATQGIDYFQHIGDIEWKPEVKDYFGKTLKLWHLMGKYHLPHAEVAIINSDRNLRLLGFPWDVARDPNVVFSDNRWWALINQLVDTYPRAGIEEDDFARGNVDQYRIVLDGNTTIMDPELVDQIENWVRRGGTFITFQQTGRHTSVQPDSWPISKLTGYAVTGIDKLAPNGDGRPSRRLHLVEGQNVFDPGAPGWQYVKNSAGLSLKKIDPDCEDLLQWDDGSIAAGMRRLGKGLVINLGVNSSAAVPMVLEYLHVQHVAATTGDHSIVTRHFISNNGLYDIYALWNSNDKPMPVTLKFNNGIRPDYCRDVNTGENMPIDYADNIAKLLNVQLDNWQTRVFISPRAQLANAATEWFKLQQGWWRGMADPGSPIPIYKPKLAINLTDDWAFKPLVETIPLSGTVVADLPENTAQADPKLDDSSWERRAIGIFDIPDHPTANHGFFRKHFTVPADWNKGKALLDIGTDVPMGRARHYLDGQLVDPRTVNDKFGSTFTPGSSHLLTIEIWGASAPVGTRLPVYLSHQPDPLSRQPIKDNWAVAENVLKYAPLQPLPISMKLYGTFRTIAKIDASHSDQNVILHTATDNNHQHTFYINGRAVIGAGNWDVNITPWVKFGQDNELIVFCDNTTLQDASIDYYDKAGYP